MLCLVLPPLPLFLRPVPLAVAKAAPAFLFSNIEAVAVLRQWQC